ncbi:MAG: right-handed parallel beta-helix repeat-containing protein [Thermoplasmata archaeon]
MHWFWALQSPGRMWRMKAALGLIALLLTLSSVPLAQPGTGEPASDAGNEPSQITQARQPPPDRDWEVSSSQYYSSQTIQLSHNLTILSGGNLTLQNVRLVLSPLYDGQLHIEVRSGGSLTLLDGDSNPATREDATVVSSATGLSYAFRVLTGGRFLMRNSILKNCGWEMGARGENAGLYIQSADCSVEHCELVENYCGIAVDNCAPWVKNCTFFENRMAGLYARDSNLRVEGNTFEKSGRSGLELYCCDATLLGNIFRSNLHEGLLARSSSLLSERNIFQLNTHQGIEAESSYVVSKLDEFYENEIGAYFLESGFELDAALFESNRYGVYLRDGRGVLRNTTFTKSAKSDIYLDMFENHSEVVSFNSTFSSVGFGDSVSVLLVRWVVCLSVVWESTGGPVPGALVRVYCQGVNILNLTAGADGALPPFILTQYEQTRAGRRDLNPYRFGTFQGRYFNSTYVTVDRNIFGALVLDDVPPYFTLTSPRDNMTTTKPFVNVTGNMSSDVYATLTVNGARVDIDLDTGKFSTRVPLTEGDNIINVTAVDNIGNIFTVLRRVHRDSTPPNLTVELPETPLLINCTSLIVKGRTDPSSYVKVCGRIAEVSEDGAFEVLVELQEGQNIVSVYAMDQLGNHVWANRTVVVDTLPPELLIYSPAHGSVTNHRTVTVSGRADAGASVFHNGTRITSTGGEWSAQVSLFEGPNNLTFSAVDAAGNWNETTLLIILDTVPPVAKILFPVDGAFVNYTPVNLTGVAEPGAVLSSTAGEPVASADGTFYLVWYLTNGRNTVYLEVRDAAGNRWTLSLSVTLDTEVNLTLFRPRSPMVTESSTVWVEGVTEPGSNVTINEFRIAVLPDGSFKSRVRLRPGPNTIWLNITDPAGNDLSIPMLVELRPPHPSALPLFPVVLIVALVIVVALGVAGRRLGLRRAATTRPRPAVPPEYLERPIIKPAEAGVERLRCTGCGEPVEEYWVTCHSCGRALDPEEMVAAAIEALRHAVFRTRREVEIAEMLARLHDDLQWLKLDGEDISAHRHTLTLAAQMLARGERLERVEELAEGLAREVTVRAAGIRERREQELERVETELRTRIRTMLDEVSGTITELNRRGFDTREIERLLSGARLQLRAGNLEKACRNVTEAKKVAEQLGGVASGRRDGGD